MATLIKGMFNWELTSSFRGQSVIIMVAAVAHMGLRAPDQKAERHEALRF